jgi:hypothetical protein
MCGLRGLAGMALNEATLVEVVFKENVTVTATACTMLGS